MLPACQQRSVISSSWRLAVGNTSLPFPYNNWSVSDWWRWYYRHLCKYHRRARLFPTKFRRMIWKTRIGPDRSLESFGRNGVRTNKKTGDVRFRPSPLLPTCYKLVWLYAVFASHNRGLCAANMTSSINRKYVTNYIQHRRRKTEPLAHATCQENLVIPEICVLIHRGP